MIKIKYIYLSIICLIGIHSLQSQHSFPLQWVGEWQGELCIIRAADTLDRVPCEMHIYKDSLTESIYHWRTTYQAAQPITKEYELHVIDIATGEFLIDERNGIKIESYLYGDNELVSHYAVMQRFFHVRYVLQADDTLLFEISVIGGKPVSTTGDTLILEQAIPAVETYPCQSIQRAVLHRLN